MAKFSPTAEELIAWVNNNPEAKLRFEDHAGTGRDIRAYLINDYGDKYEGGPDEMAQLLAGDLNYPHLDSDEVDFTF